MINYIGMVTSVSLRLSLKDFNICSRSDLIYFNFFFFKKHSVIHTVFYPINPDKYSKVFKSVNMAKKKKNCETLLKMSDLQFCKKKKIITIFTLFFSPFFRHLLALQFSGCEKYARVFFILLVFLKEKFRVAQNIHYL